MNSVRMGDCRLAAMQGESLPVEVALIDDGVYYPGKYKTTFSIQLRSLDNVLTAASAARIDVGPVSKAYVTIINTNAQTGTIRIVHPSTDSEIFCPGVAGSAFESGSRRHDSLVNERRRRRPGTES